MLHAIAVITVVELLVRWVPLPRLSRLLGVPVNLAPGRPMPSGCRWGSCPPHARRQLRCARRVADAGRSAVDRACVDRWSPATCSGVSSPALRLGMVGSDALAARPRVGRDRRPSARARRRLPRVPAPPEQDRHVSAASAGVYAQCGLRMRSEVELEPAASRPTRAGTSTCGGGPRSTAPPKPPPGDVIAEHGSDRESLVHGDVDRSGYLLRFHDCGEFVVSADLTEVEVRPDPAGRTEILPILMAGTVSAFLLAAARPDRAPRLCVAIDGSVSPSSASRGGASRRLRR